MLIDNLKILCEACIKILRWTTKELPHIKELVKGGKINLFTKYQISSIKGKDKLESLESRSKMYEEKLTKEL